MGFVQRQCVQFVEGCSGEGMSPSDSDKAILFPFKRARVVEVF